MPARPRRVVVAFFYRFMRTRAGRAVMAPVFPRLQRGLFRLSRGRLNVSSILVPSLMLYTTGAKSGRRRETPLLCAQQADGSLLVSGSNWARPQHPAWTANLLACPEAQVAYRGRTFTVGAALLPEHERDAAWSQFETLMPGYRQYEIQSGRTVRIFRLRPR